MLVRNLSSFKSLSALLEYLPTEKACIEYFIKLRWPDGVTCPYNPDHKQNRIHHYEGGFSYKCRDCRRNFSYTVGTIFQNTKIPLRVWFEVIFGFNSDRLGKSSSQKELAKKVTQKTAWHMLQRIRFAHNNENDRFLFDKSAVIHVDEAVDRGANGNKAAHKKDLNAQGRSLQISSKIWFGMVDTTTGRAKLFHVDTTDPETIENIIKAYVTKGATIYSDEFSAYINLTSLGYTHKVVKHKEKQYCNGNISTNAIEGVWSLLKKMVKGRYTHISKNYTQAYLNEFMHRHNLRAMEPDTMFMDTLNQGMGKYATLWELRKGIV